MKKINNYLIIMISVMSYVIALTYLKNNLIVDSLKCFMILPVMLIPKVLKKLKINISESLEFIYILFLVSAYFLGVIINLYDKIPNYDTIIHFVSGIFEAYIAIQILKTDNKIFKILFILGFVALCSVSWEIFEFISSKAFNVDPQKVIETGVDDTMKDLVVAIIGGIIVFIIDVKNYHKNIK